jgi:hypothetical protein
VRQISVVPPGAHAAPCGGGTLVRQLHFFFGYLLQSATTTPSVFHGIR